MQDQAAERKDSYRASLRRALLLVEEAIDIVDLAEAPADIAAHLEAGRHRLQVCLGLDR